MDKNKTAVVAGTEADPTLVFTPLNLNGKSYKLIYDFDAIARAEKETGLPLLIGVDWNNVTVLRFRGMLYSALLRAQPEITLDEVTGLLTPIDIGVCEDALAAAWISSKPVLDPNALAATTTTQNP